MISEQQIRAAAHLHDKLQGWADADEALRRARTAFPDNVDRQSVLVKASVVDRLYSTRVGRIYAAADHIVALVGRVEAGDWQPEDRREFVHELAKVPNDKCKNGYELLTSFASKYAHFFVVPREVGVEGGFPIYDSYASRAVLYLSGSRGDLSQRSRPYYEFCRLLGSVLPPSSEIGCRQVDRYLWLMGQYLAFRDGREAQLNRDVARLFRDGDERTQLMITELVQ